MCVSIFPAGRQVDEDEDVVLDEAGEAQKDGVEEDTRETKASVQRPLVEVNSQNLDRQMQTNSETETHTQTDPQIDTDRDKQRPTQRDTHTNIYRSTETNRQTDE